jgi:hypothetical protein
LLQEACWTSQNKSLFKFGIVKVDLSSGGLDPIMEKTLKIREGDKGETGLLIAIDHLD